jgi:hypothetical protein
MAAYDADKRKQDTLYRKTDRADMRRVADRLSGMSVDEMVSLGVGERQCGRFSRWGPRAPNSLNGTPLHSRTGQPARPQRPDR